MIDQDSKLSLGVKRHYKVHIGVARAQSAWPESVQFDNIPTFTPDAGGTCFAKTGQ